MHWVQAKRTQARNAIQAISSSPSIGASHLGVDSSLMAGGRAAGRIISPSWLAACAALMGTPAAAMAFVAATSSTVQVWLCVDVCQMAVHGIHTALQPLGTWHANVTGHSGLVMSSCMCMRC